MVGVRANARCTNACALIKMVDHGIEEFFQFRRAAADSADNKLVAAVRADLKNPLILRQLWLVETLSHGLLQPLSHAINKSETTKSMYSMRDAFALFEGRFAVWCDGKELDELRTGALWRAAAVSGVPESGSTGQRTESKAWVERRRANVPDSVLQRAVQKLRPVWERFTAEYRSGGVLHGEVSETVKRIASIVPPSNDTVERTFGMVDRLLHSGVTQTTANVEARVMAAQNHTIDWLLKLPEAEAARVMRAARDLSIKQSAATKEYEEECGHASDQRKRTLAATGMARAEKRKQKVQESLEIELWVSRDVRNRVKALSSKTKKLGALRQQRSESSST